MSLQNSLRVVYPAIFRREDKGGYIIEFPDVKKAATQTCENDMATGIMVAEKSLGRALVDYIENNKELPVSSNLNSIQHEKNDSVTMVLVDIEEYLKNTKPVKKTLTIPTWANDLGNKKGVNFSQLLTEALAKLV